MTPQPVRRTWWLLCLVTMTLTAAACAWRWTWLLDQAVYDAAQRSWGRPAPSDVVIVAIDDASLKAMGRWPWKRAIHAEAIRRIDRAGAKAILLNLLLSEPEADARQDEVLAEAIRGAGKVVLLVGHVPDGPGMARLLRPLAPFARSAHLAHADAMPDPDGTLRQARLWSGDATQAYPHPALALMQVAGEAPALLSRQVKGQANDHAIAIPYLGPPGHMTRVSYAALLRGEVPDEAFKGRYVLIGVTAQGLGDRFQTPVGAGMPGVEVSAQFLTSLRQDRRVQAMPAPWNAALSALLVLGLLLAYTRMAPRRAFMLAVATVCLGPFAAWLLMAGGLWWPPFGLALGAVLSYPLWSWYKLETTARDLEAELHRLSGDPGVQTTWPASELAGSPRSDFMSQRTDALSHAGAQLRQARQVLARTLAALPDAVFVVDASHHIARANDQAALMTGLPSAEALVGRHFSEVLSSWSPTDAPSWDLLLSRAAQNGRVQHTEATHPSGQQSLMALVAVEGGPDAVDAEVIVCATDVSALRQAELQRAELLGFIAHDIRSPQASLVSLVELHRIGGKMSHEEMLGHVEAMARQSLDLCEELLQVMRAETRPIAPTPGDLAVLATGCMGEMRLQAGSKQITLHADWPEGLHMPAVFDDYLLHRALNNLLSNAIKFSPKSGLVVVSLEAQPGYHVLSVRDQGPGIPESEIGRLFKRYERVEQGRPSNLAAGIGLGLVFIDTVARRHGGHVKIINRPGEGACFEMWLPAQSLPS
jgi:CHASE2 domain-containing sensor protein/signal transduction histidine kinase